MIQRQASCSNSRTSGPRLAPVSARPTNVYITTRFVRRASWIRPAFATNRLAPMQKTTTSTRHARSHFRLLCSRVSSSYSWNWTRLIAKKKNASIAVKASMLIELATRHDFCTSFVITSRKRQQQQQKKQKIATNEKISMQSCLTLKLSTWCWLFFCFFFFFF